MFLSRDLARLRTALWDVSDSTAGTPLSVDLAVARARQMGDQAQAASSELAAALTARKSRDR
ncbi:hypothetical protein GCM10027579_03720 [Calidifontibacter terrae]